MTGNHRQQAEKVVEGFREQLGDAARAQISHAQLEDLTLAIMEVLSEEATTAADMVQELLERLRARQERSELGI